MKARVNPQLSSKALSSKPNPDAGARSVAASEGASLTKSVKTHKSMKSMQVVKTNSPTRLRLKPSQIRFINSKVSNPEPAAARRQGRASATRADAGARGRA